MAFVFSGTAFPHYAHPFVAPRTPACRQLQPRQHSSGGRTGGGWPRQWSGGERRHRHTPGKASRGRLGFHLNRPIPALHDHSAPGRRPGDPGAREVGRHRARRHAHRADRSRAAGRHCAEHRVAARIPSGRCHVLAGTGHASRLAAKGRSDQPERARYGQAQSGDGGSAAGRSRRPGARRPGAAALLPRHRADDRGHR